jgi:hypothetical protein
LDQAYRHAARHVAEAFRTAAVLQVDEVRTHAARGLIGSGLDGPEDIDRVVEALHQRGIMLHGERARLIIGVKDGMRVTNTYQVAIEQGVAEAAQLAASDRSGALPPPLIEQAIAVSGLDFAGEPAHAAAQRAAIHALGGGGRLGVVIGVAGAGKTTLMGPLVKAWQAHGQDVIGLGLAWRQADALQETGIRTTYAVSTFLQAVQKGEVQVGRRTVLAIDEVSQIGPRQFLALLEIQQATGCTIKALGDPEQCQAIEAGDTMEILRRALPKAAMPELLSTVRQESGRARRIAGLFREGRAAEALAMKRVDGTAMLVGGDEDQVICRIADHYLARRDALRGAGAARGVTVSAPTNADAAAISRAIRGRLRARGELGRDEIVRPAIDSRGERYDLAIATGDRLRLFRKTFGTADGKRAHLGSNGQVVEVVGRDADGLRLRNVADRSARAVHVAWDRLTDRESGRLLLGFGHCLTIDSAQGITSGEHINAMPRGSAGVTAFKAYVAESRHVSQVWTMVSEAAEWNAERMSRPLGDIRPVTSDEMWARVARNLSEKPYKPLGMDLLEQVRADRQQVNARFIAGCERVQRTAGRDDLAAEAATHRAAEAVRRAVAPQLGGLQRAIVVQRDGVADFARVAVEEIGRLGRAMRDSALRLGQGVATLRHEPEAPAPRRRSPGMGF